MEFIIAKKDLVRELHGVVRVPGAWELPVAVRTLATTQKYDAGVVLGAVIRGATAHFEHVCNTSIQGTAAVMNDLRFPIGLGILTTDTIEQAIERAGSKAGNKGFEAAIAALETANVLAALRQE